MNWRDQINLLNILKKENSGINQAQIDSVDIKQVSSSVSSILLSFSYFCYYHNKKYKCIANEV